MVGETQAGELIEFLMSLDGRSQKLANLMLAAGCLSEVRNRRAIQRVDQMLLRRLFEDAISFDPSYYYEPWQEWDEVGPTRPKAVALIASVWKSPEVHRRLTSVAEFSRDWIGRMAALQGLARGWKDDPETLPLLTAPSPTKRRCAERRYRNWPKGGLTTLIPAGGIVRSDENYGVREAAVQGLARGWKGRPRDPALAEGPRSAPTKRKMCGVRRCRSWPGAGRTMPRRSPG